MKHPADELRDAMRQRQEIEKERREVAVQGSDPTARRRGPVSWLFRTFVGLVLLILLLGFVAFVTGNGDAISGLADSVLDALPR